MARRHTDACQDSYEVEVRMSKPWPNGVVLTASPACGGVVPDGAGKNVPMDQRKLEAARRALGVEPKSEAIDLALDLVAFRREVSEGIAAMRRGRRNRGRVFAPRRRPLKYALDTNTYIEAFRNPETEEALLRFLDRALPFTFLSAVVLQELAAGARTTHGASSSGERTRGAFPTSPLAICPAWNAHLTF
jgi:hypothetical protein